MQIILYYIYVFVHIEVKIFQHRSDLEKGDSSYLSRRYQLIQFNFFNN